MPEIEILMVSKKEDFSVLKVSLESAIKMSVNPVSSITIIVPDNEVNLVKTFLNVMAEFQKINVIPENKVVTKEVIELITKNRPDKFGWILQQVLVASYIINSRSEYILVVDADTVLLRPRIWVDKNSNSLMADLTLAIDSEMSMKGQTIKAWQLVFLISVSIHL